MDSIRRRCSFCKVIHSSAGLLSLTSTDAGASVSKATVIESAIHRLLNAGYKPILAHAERYVSYHRDWKRIMAMRENSVLIQIDADSYTGSWGRHAKHMSKLLIKNRIVDIVSSDAHDLKHRPPSLRHYYDCVCRSCGQEYADHIFYDNPVRVLSQGGVNQTT